MSVADKAVDSGMGIGGDVLRTALDDARDDRIDLVQVRGNELAERVRRSGANSRATVHDRRLLSRRRGRLPLRPLDGSWRRRELRVGEFAV